MNLCVTCGEDFSNVSMFDRHRVGKHEYLFSEGVAMNPPRYDGRRCLDTIEMAAKGWERDIHGRWRDGIRQQATQMYFQKLDSRPEIDSEPLPKVEVPPELP